MRRKLNIMVTGAKGGRAHAISKALSNAAMLPSVCDFEVFPIDITPFAVGLHHSPFYLNAHVLPRIEDDPNAWAQFIVEHDIHVIFPTSDLDLEPLAQYAVKWFTYYNCQVMVSEPAVCHIANDKAMTCVNLKECGIRVPPSFWTHPDADHVPVELDMDTFWKPLEYPRLVKPRRGANSRGINIAHNNDELLFYWQHTPDPIVQEYIQGDEYSGAITYDKDGQAQAFFVTRVYERRGHMTLGEVADYPHIRAFLRVFAAQTQSLGFSHALNVQMIERNGEIFVIELNSCCSGSTAIRAAFGMNQPEQLILHHCFGYPITQPAIRHGVAMTFTDELVLYDTTYAEIEKSTIGRLGEMILW